MQIRITTNTLNTKEYQSIRATTGWAFHNDKAIDKALQNDLFSICAYDKDKLVGIGRVIGDGAIYFYLQDIIVIPAYQKQGIGKVLMKNIENYLSIHTNENSFVGLMAADGVKSFYEKYGYKVRPESKPGMYKTIKK